MKSYEVVAAIIFHNEEILCVKRGENRFEYVANKFEFPGGKIESGETKEEALIREIKEELSLSIEIEKEFLTINHKYPDFILTMYSFICKSETKKITLNEHIDFKWLNKNNLTTLNWAEADIPIVKKLQGF